MSHGAHQWLCQSLLPLLDAPLPQHQEAAAVVRHLLHLQMMLLLLLLVELSLAQTPIAHERTGKVARLPG